MMGKIIVLYIDHREYIQAQLRALNKEKLHASGVTSVKCL